MWWELEFYFPLDSSLFKRKPINHQPNRCYWKVVPLLRTVDPAFFLKMLPKWRLCIYLGSLFWFDLFCGFFFFFSMSAWQIKLPRFVFSCFVTRAFALGART